MCIPEVHADAKLCYVSSRGPWAFFTTQELAKQTGDGWHRTPYEHNSGEPYTATQPGEDWQIVKVAFDAEDLLATPDDGHANSPWSVEAINAGAIAWLRTSPYACSDVPLVIIPAGTPLREFVALVTQAGGRVYAEVLEEEHANR